MSPRLHVSLSCRGPILLIDNCHGVLGRNVLNHLSLVFDGPTGQSAEQGKQLGTPPLAWARKPVVAPATLAGRTFCCCLFLRCLWGAVGVNGCASCTWPAKASASTFLTASITFKPSSGPLTFVRLSRRRASACCEGRSERSAHSECYRVSGSSSSRCCCGTRGASFASSVRMAGSGLATTFLVLPRVAKLFPHSEHVWIGDGV